MFMCLNIDLGILFPREVIFIFWVKYIQGRESKTSESLFDVNTSTTTCTSMLVSIFGFLTSEGFLVLGIHILEFRAPTSLVVAARFIEKLLTSSENTPKSTRSITYTSAYEEVF